MLVSLGMIFFNFCKNLLCEIMYICTCDILIFLSILSSYWAASLLWISFCKKCRKKIHLMIRKLAYWGSNLPLKCLCWINENMKGLLGEFFIWLVFPVFQAWVLRLAKKGPRRCNHYQLCILLFLVKSFLSCNYFSFLYFIFISILLETKYSLCNDLYWLIGKRLI